MARILKYIGSAYILISLTQKQPLNEEGSEKPNKWIGSNKYVGDWKDNKKKDFGIQNYQNGDKFECGCH